VGWPPTTADNMGAVAWLGIIILILADDTGGRKFVHVDGVMLFIPPAAIKAENPIGALP